jgi:hypothetical protein
LVIALNVVELQVADGENVIWALGAGLVNGAPFSAEIVELVNVMIAPVLGMPFTVKLELNQIHSPELMGVPLKFDEFVDCAVQGGGGGAPQVRLAGEKLMGVEDPSSVAVPEKLTVPFKAGNEPMMVSLNVSDLPVLKGIELVIGATPEGAIVKSI